MEQQVEKMEHHSNHNKNRTYLQNLQKNKAKSNYGGCQETYTIIKELQKYLTSTNYFLHMKTLW